MNQIDMVRFLHEHAQRCEEEARQGRETIAELCKTLEDQDIALVRIEYNGYGDDGAVETVVACNDDSTVDIDKGLADQLRDAAYAVLPDGWEIDEGSYGELVLDVAGRKVTREHNWRIESTEYEKEEWKL